MTTSKVDNSGLLQHAHVGSPATTLLLPTSQVAIRRNGIEFLSPTSIPLWTEVTVELRSPGNSQRVRGGGVVVDCTGNRHTGYVVSLVFMNLTRQSQEHLSRLVLNRLV